MTKEEIHLKARIEHLEIEKQHSVSLTIDEQFILFQDQQNKELQKGSETLAESYGEALNEITQLKTKLEEANKEVEKRESSLEEINNAMWESFMIKGNPFKKEDGIRIMNELEKWSDNY